MSTNSIALIQKLREEAWEETRKRIDGSRAARRGRDLSVLGLFPSYLKDGKIDSKIFSELSSLTITLQALIKCRNNAETLRHQTLSEFPTFDWTQYFDTNGTPKKNIEIPREFERPFHLFHQSFLLDQMLHGYEAATRVKADSYYSETGTAFINKIRDTSGTRTNYTIEEEAVDSLLNEFNIDESRENEVESD